MTPTCRTCGAKFPGKTECKHCGADPNAVPTVATRVARAIGVRKNRPKPVDKKARAAAKAGLRSLRGPIGRPKKKHGRQVPTR